MFQIQWLRFIGRFKKVSINMFITKVTISDLPGRTHMAELQITTHEHMAESQICFLDYW